MHLDAAEKFDEMYRNRYEAVLLVAKHARRMNLERLRQQSEEGEQEALDEKRSKVIIQATKDVLDGKVQFERIEKA